MYGETGDLMRTELAALLRQHRILHRLGDHTPSAPGAVPEREVAGMVIQQYRQTILSWCTEAVMAAKPLVFSATLPAPANPFQTSNEPGTAVSELARALRRARDASTTSRASISLLGTASKNEVVEHWRRAARAAALAEHDTNGDVGVRLTSPQAEALVGDVAAVTQALVVLDQRYLNMPGWQRLTEPGRLGWAALATALDVSLGQPDYSVDNTGWRPRTHTLRIGPQSGILGVLQAEHDLLVRLKSFPTAMNLRLIVDSQQRLSRRLAILAERTDAPHAGVWRARAASYSVLKQRLRNVGGRVGKGRPAVAEAANATARLRDFGHYRPTPSSNHGSPLDFRRCSTGSTNASRTSSRRASTGVPPPARAGPPVGHRQRKAGHARTRAVHAARPDRRQGARRGRAQTRPARRTRARRTRAQSLGPAFSADPPARGPAHQPRPTRAHDLRMTSVRSSPSSHGGVAGAPGHWMPSRDVARQRLLVGTRLHTDAGYRRTPSVMRANLSLFTMKEHTMSTTTDPSMEGGILTIDQAAAYLSIPKATLYTWRTRRVGFGPPAVKLGGSLRYRRSDLDAWVSEHLETFADTSTVFEPRAGDGVSLSRSSRPR